MLSYKMLLDTLQLDTGYVIEVEMFDVNKSELIGNKYHDPYIKTLRDCLQDRRYRRMLTTLFPIDFTQVQQLVQVKISQRARDFVRQQAKVVERESEYLLKVETTMASFECKAQTDWKILYSYVGCC